MPCGRLINCSIWSRTLDVVSFFQIDFPLYFENQPLCDLSKELGASIYSCLRPGQLVNRYYIECHTYLVKRVPVYRVRLDWLPLPCI